MTARQTAQTPEDCTRGVFRDTAFAANRDAPVHRWVPWIAGFSSQFVEDALNRYLDGVGTVLDPFAGVGTTLVEADRAGHDVIGFEINPYAAFASRTKLGAHRMDHESLTDVLADFVAFMKTAEATMTDPTTRPPEGFHTHTPFYSPKVLRKVLLVQDFITSLENDIENMFRLAFASSMVTYSNYSYEPSLGRRSAVGKACVDDFSVTETICRKVEQMAHDSRWYSQTRAGSSFRKDGSVLERSFLDWYRDIEPQSVDLLVTSPPYLNNYHYNRNTRPHLYWLGFCKDTREMRRLEKLNFGEYWQNARGMTQVALDPRIHNREIHETIDNIRSRNGGKEIYGGRGWANYAALYFNDSVRFMLGAKRCLRHGATALVVIGNSILQGIPVPTDRFLARIAEEQGLKVTKIHKLRMARVGSSIVDSSVRAGRTDGKTPLYESVVEMHRP